MVLTYYSTYSPSPELSIQGFEAMGKMLKFYSEARVQMLNLAQFSPIFPDSHAFFAFFPPGFSAKCGLSISEILVGVNA